MRKLLTDFLQSRPPPHCPPPDPCGLPPSPPPPSSQPTPCTIIAARQRYEHTISHIIKFICHSPAYTIPPPCRRVSRCERGVLLLGCVLCVGGGGREGGVGPTVPAPRPAACGGQGARVGGSELRPRRRARRVAAPIVYSPYFLVLGTHDQPQRRTNPAAQTTQSQPACTPQPEASQCLRGGLHHSSPR